MKVGDYLKSLRPALDGSAAMALAVLALQWKLPLAVHWLRLGIEIGAGALSYVAAIAVFHRERVSYFLTFAKKMRKPKLQAEAGVA
jgi:hypothetical protein